ncbi:MAG TPA: hypothetical protein VK163_04325 [Opitutaceae bacterium]|nr:hypothetical protein [Opitutaceae bacterium]
MPPKQPHPLLWLAEPLRENPSYLDKPMFGGRAVHFDGRFVLYLAWKDEPWRGVLVPTEREHQASLIAEFPALAPHPVLPKWLYLTERAETFEADAQRLVALIRRLDPRIGVLPGTKAKKPAQTGVRSAATKRKHFMLE